MKTFLISLMPNNLLYLFWGSVHFGFPSAKSTKNLKVDPRKISKFRRRGNPSIFITVKFNPIKVVMLVMFRNYSSPCHLSLIESFVASRHCRS